MYRCILFAPCLNITDNEKLFSVILSTLTVLLDGLGIKIISEMAFIRASIGPWFACLSYPYRQLEIGIDFLCFLF